jgi:nucleoside-diphosphate-sugar epimerase
VIGDGTCLVTGASGFIGGHLTQRLVREGFRVRCLVRASSDTSLLAGLDVELVVGDLTSAPSLARAVEGCRSVFHCAALVSDWATVPEIARINVEGTRDLLAAAAAASVQRLVHFSTTDVHARRSRSWYARTKLAAESEVRRAQTEHRLDAVILRPATVYGPRSTEVIGEIARAIRGRHMVLIDGGRPLAGLCYVDNLVDAALLALRHEAAPGRAFDVSDGLDVTWRQLTDDLADGLRSPRVRWSLPYRVAFPIGFALEHGYRLARRATGLTTAPLLSRQAVHVLGVDQDFSARDARELLGWEPGVDYAAGLRATLDWLAAVDRGDARS